MKKRSTVVTAGIVAGMLITSAAAFAHGIDKHGAMVHPDAQMMKMHAMMPMFSLASAGLESALEKGDIAAVEAEAGRITSATPDLKKSTPHKNVSQRKKFVGHATALEKTVTSTVALAKKGDFAGAKIAFGKVEEACAACHAKFRD